MSIDVISVGVDPVQTALSDLRSQSVVEGASVKILKDAINQSAQVLDLLQKTLQSMGVGGSVNMKA